MKKQADFKQNKASEVIPASLQAEVGFGKLPIQSLQLIKKLV